MQPRSDTSFVKVWRQSATAAIAPLLSLLSGVILVSCAPGGWVGRWPWQAPLLAVCGLSHGVQLPAMHFAARSLRWHADYATLELNHRIAIVLRWTLPISMGGLGLLLVCNRHAALTTPLGQHLSLFWLGQLLLAARRHWDVPERAFEHRRLEIVYLVLGLGLLTGLHANGLGQTQLGVDLCFGFASLLYCRALLQLTFYQKAWPRELRVQGAALFLLFVGQASVLSACALGVVGKTVMP